MPSTTTATEHLTLWQFLAMKGIRKAGEFADGAKIPASAASALLSPAAYPKARERAAKFLGITVPALLRLCRNGLDEEIREAESAKRK